MNLKRKIGPLPLWVWLILAAILGWYLYRRVKGTSGSSGQAIETQQILPQTSAQPAPSLGGATQAGTPGSSDQTTQDFLQVLGAENANLIDAIVTSPQFLNRRAADSPGRKAAN